MKKPIPPESVALWIERNFEYKTRKEGSEYVICNPFDGDDGFHFNIRPEGGVCHDWRGDGWAPVNKFGKQDKSFLGLVQRHLSCGYREAVEAVVGKGNFALYAGGPKDYKRCVQVVDESPMSLPRGAMPIAGDDGRIALGLARWLVGRGLTPELIAAYGIHYLGMDVIWPYYEYELLVYWQSRCRTTKRFLFPSESVGVTKGMFLYGFDLAEPASHLIVTEAIFDAHSIGEQALATGGAQLTNRQVSKLKALNPRDGVILAPDNDRAGLASLAYNGELLLSHGFKVYASIPPQVEYTDREGQAQVTKDWNDLGKYAVGWGKVRGVLESHLEKLDRQGISKIRLAVK